MVFEDFGAEALYIPFGQCLVGGDDDDERVGERIASVSLVNIVQPSLAQPRGEVFNPPTVDSTYEGWSDFTADPDQEGE